MNIAIIGAMDNEIELFNDMFDLTLIDEKYHIYTCNYKNKNLFITKCGIGKVNSAACVQYLIDKYSINYIINTGCAGALTKKIKVMDIIISNYVTYHDFKPIRIMEYSTPNNGKMYADDKLIKLVIKALKNLEISNYHKANIASGDHFVTNVEERDNIYEDTKTEVVDMESASIAHISLLNEVPFVIIRTISDFADGVENFETKAAHLSSKIVKEILNII